MKGSFYVISATLTAVIACAHPKYVEFVPATDAAARAADDFVEAPVIQVRQYNRSPTVSVVAWIPGEDAYGLLARIRRDGSLVRDHRIYVSTYYLGGGNIRANRERTDVVQTVVPAKLLLKSTGVSRDDYHCFYGRRCSPYETRGVRVPDSLLRANRDSVAVRMYARAGLEITVTVHRDLIDAYLATVDSVSASLRRKN